MDERWRQHQHHGPGQKLKFAQALISDVLRSFQLSVEYRGLLAVERAKVSPKVIWTSGTDDAVSRTANLLVTDKGGRGIRQPSDGGNGSEHTLWIGGKALSAPSTEIMLMLESDGMPAVYNGGEVIWHPKDWNRNI